MKIVIEFQRGGKRLSCFALKTFNDFGFARGQQIRNVLVG